MAIAERKRGRTVPGLEPDGLISIKVTYAGGEVAPALPGIGHQAHQRLGDLPAALHEELERVVERGRIRSFRPDDAAELRLELGLAGPHPGPVAGDRVDLAVVGKEPEGLRQPPVGHGVGRVALVKYGHPALARFIAQVEIEVGEPRTRHQALVDDRPAGARGQVHAHAFLGAPSLRATAREV